MENKIPKHDRAKEIAKVAARLFGSKGYQETAMSDIVAASGFSKGAIYHYYPQKDDILFAVLNSYMDLVIGELETELAPLPKGESQIKHIINRHIDLYVNNIFEAKTLFHDAQNLPPEKYSIIANKQRHYYSIVAQALRNYLGVAPNESLVGVITFTLFGMCNWIYSWYDPKKEINPNELSAIIFKTFTGGAKHAC